MNVVPTDLNVVRGSHGRSEATEVRDLILDLIAIPDRTRSTRSVG
ncbi:MAG TPA: hypothetical protein VFZ63_07210 [Jiangellaceae bacterium]